MKDKYLEMRMDVRTEEDFETDIRQYTRKEFYWGIALRYYLQDIGLPCSIEEHGVDNTGRLITGRLPNHNADKIYHFKDGKEMKVEVKTIPEWCDKYMTFKVSALKGCWNQGAYILVPKTSCFHLFGKDSFVHLLGNLEVRTDIGTFGYKPVVRAETYIINKMIDLGMVVRKEWTPRSKKYINSMRELLVEDRRTSLAPA
jgi:hypothetical protein